MVWDTSIVVSSRQAMDSSVNRLQMSRDSPRYTFRVRGFATLLRGRSACGVRKLIGDTFLYRLHEFEMNVSVYDNLFNFILWSRLVPIPYFNLLQWNLHCNNYFLLPIALCGWSPCPGFIRGCKVESKTCLVGSKKLETIES